MTATLLRTVTEAPARVDGLAATVDPIGVDPPSWDRPAVLRQRWDQLAYFHWRYEADVVQELLPSGLTVDTFDGSAWVGLIPFEMRDVRVGPTPPVPWLGSFIEVNVRTYVIDALGRRAVWFFSLDVPRAAIVGVARTVFSLPYCWARVEHVIEGRRHRYRIERRWPRATPAFADMAFTVGAPMPDPEISELDHFLTARWGLVTAGRAALRHGRVDHQRWPLHTVHDVAIDENVIEAAGLPKPSGSPHARYSPGVDVRVAWFVPIAADLATPRFEV